MQRQVYTPQHAIAGIKQEQIDQANDRIDQAERAAQQQVAAQLPTLRARAAELLGVLVTGPGAGELQQAIGWADAASDPPHIAGAAVALRTAIERWAQSAALVGDMNRAIAPALAAQQQQRAAERRPTALSIEERLARIEQAPGLV